jgi:hypothetical protein
MDLLTAGFGLYREACVTSCDGNKVIKVKDQNVTDTQEDVDLLPAIESENDVSCMAVYYRYLNCILSLSSSYVHRKYCTAEN